MTTRVARLRPRGLRRAALRPTLRSGRRLVGAKSAALFASRMSNERSADELRSRWCPQPDFHQQPMLRTHLLCDLSYGDQIGARVR